MAVTLSTIKAIAAAGTFVTGLCGFLVFALRRIEKAKLALVISYSNAFGSGVIISVGLVHMLAEAHATLEEFYPNYPMSFFLAGIGFAIIYLFEDVVMGEIVLRHGQEMKNGGLVPHVHGQSGNHNDHDCETGRAVPNDTTQSNQKTGDENTNRFGKSQAEKNVGEYVPNDDAFTVPVNSDEILPTHHRKPSNVRTTLLALTLLGSISVHAFFGGLALGASPTSDTVWPTFAAIVLHKGVEAFVVGNAFLNSALKPFIVAILLVLFASVTPIGIAVGLGVSSAASRVEVFSGSMVSVSAGTFLYIGTLILKEEAQPDRPLLRMHNWIRFGLWLIGFGIMAIVAIWA